MSSQTQNNVVLVMSIRHFRKMNKDHHKYIIREVVTTIGDSGSNAENNKTEKFQKEIQVYSNIFLVKISRRTLKIF